MMICRKTKVGYSEAHFCIVANASAKSASQVEATTGVVWNRGIKLTQRISRFENVVRGDVEDHLLGPPEMGCAKGDEHKNQNAREKFAVPTFSGDD